MPILPEILPNKAKKRERPRKNPKLLLMTIRVSEISGITNAKKTGIKGKTQGLKNDNNPPEKAVKKLTEFVMAREFIGFAPFSKLLKVTLPH